MTLNVVIEIALVIVVIAALAWGWRQRRELIAEREYWQRKRVTSASQQLPALFLATASALESGVLVLDQAYRITFANEALGRIFSVDRNRIVGQGVITLLRDHQTDALIKQAVQTGEKQIATIQPVLSSRTLHVTCFPLISSEDYSAIVLLRDITQLVQLERARREMVANVSHELRTPLASIKLLVETLQNAPPQPDAQRMLRHIDDELASMTHLVDELRELSQIESGRMAMTLRAADIAAIVERAATRVQPQAERRDQKLQVEVAPDLPPALIDSERVGQVLLNLLNNAIKFTPGGGTITIRACTTPDLPPIGTRLARELAQTDLDRAVLISIADTGIGIPAHEVDRVFERFYKVDRARTRDSGGTGLGLAIAKHLIERHGGRIWVESIEGRGSTFSLLLPIA